MSDVDSSLLANRKSDEERKENPKSDVCVGAEKGITRESGSSCEIHVNNEEVSKNSLSEQLSTSVSNQSLDDDYTLIDSEAFSTKNNSISEITTERLLPLLNVSTSIKPTRPPRLRRTFSVDHTYIDKERQKMFGSEESIPSTSTASKISHSSSSLEKQKSHDSISRRNPGSATPSSSLLRRRSLNKSNPVLPKTTPKRRSLENSQKIERAANETLNIKKVEPKVNSIRKQPIKPRSQVVAAVTSRLYSKINRKEAATSTNDLSAQKSQASKEVNTYSNAKSRLREITRRALRAHRQKNEQTQTDLVSVVRVKEMSTDVDDLKISLEEVRNAETDPVGIETKDASVNCTFSDQSNDDKSHNIISFTRSCGTQSSAESINVSNNTEKENTSARPAPNPISFTKYLREIQDPKYEITDVMPNAPIYTKTVNINISHNYINESRGNGSMSDDSIEQNLQNVCLPTPDLISNHNSLEQGHDDSEQSEIKDRSNVNDMEKINYANMGVLDEYFTVNESIVLENENKKCTVATYTVVPRCSEKVQSVSMEKVQAPEICVTNKFEEGFCKPLPKFEPNLAKSKIVESKYYTCDDCIKLEEPLVLKSIVKQLPKNNISNDNNPSSSEEEIFSSDLPDSLDYHMANTKKVKFNRKNAKRLPENGRMLNAMSEFLEEATNLMNNLTMAASKIGSNNIHLDDSYEFEVTVNGVSGGSKPYRKRRKSSRPMSVPKTKQSETMTEAFTATRFPANRSDCSTQCETDYSFLTNKYEALVEESCRRLEEKINKIPIHQQNVHCHNYKDETAERYFAYNPWESHSLGNDVEDSSLESNPVTYSDYGSLPRKTHKRHRTPTCSPSAFLKQLTNMRRQIIETSREEFLNSSSNH